MLSELGQAKVQDFHEPVAHKTIMTQHNVFRFDVAMSDPGSVSRRKRVPDLNRDLDLLEQARAAAATLPRDQPEAARRHLARWLGVRHEFLKV